MKDTIYIEHDNLWCRADRALINPISEILKYQRVVKSLSRFGPKITRKDAYYIDRRSGRFLAGLLTRVKDGLLQQNISYAIEGQDSSLDTLLGTSTSPELVGLDLRPDQLRLVNSAARERRGVLISPTGSGKTIMALGLISMYPEAKVLILAHRKDIVLQFYERIKKHLPNKDVQLITAGVRKPITGQIICSTIQSIFRHQPKNKFGIIICDECHHVCAIDSQYGLFLQRYPSPIKIGFTATLPEEREKILAMEGLLGAVIDKISLEEGRDLGIIAKPNITLIPVPYKNTIGDLRKYREIYEKGIVNNWIRNAKIIKLAADRAKNKKTSLIIITELDQGNQLMDIASKLPVSILYVHGVTRNDDRQEIKSALEYKSVDSVICTNVWKEGIDIPTVNTVILAGGGKSALQLLQSIGRGMRTAENKTEVEIIDFLDPYRYLADHAVKRLTVYAENNWL